MKNIGGAQVHKPPLWSVLKKSDKWPLCAGIFLIFAGLALILAMEPKSLWFKVMTAGIAELGFALVIAYIIIVTVDAREKIEFSKYREEKEAEFVEEVRKTERRLASRTIFSYWMNMDFPPAVEGMLEEILIPDPLLKKRQQLDWTIVPSEANPDWVILKASSKYVAVNAKRETAFVKIPLVVETAPLAPEGVASKCGIHRFEVIKGGESEATKLSTDSSSGAGFYSVDSGGIELQAGEEITVIHEYSIPKLRMDNELWRTLYLCEHVAGKIECLVDGLEIGCSAVHSKHDSAFAISRENKVINFHSKVPLLQGNGIIFWWVTV